MANQIKSYDVRFISKAEETNEITLMLYHKENPNSMEDTPIVDITNYFEYPAETTGLQLSNLLDLLLDVKVYVKSVSKEMAILTVGSVARIQKLCIKCLEEEESDLYGNMKVSKDYIKDILDIDE